MDIKRLFLFSFFSLLLLKDIYSEDFVVLSTTTGSEVLSQCSRNTIENPTSFWQPTPAQIKKVEKELSVFLKTAKCRVPSKPINNYLRQYIGVEVNGKKFIYGNYFLKGWDNPNWKITPVNVCDGGESFWGIVYNLETNTFAPPTFNGEA